MAGPGWASRQLIEAAQAGDLDSLTAVVHGAHPHVRRFAEHLCATSQDAEDAAQEALIVLYRRIGTLRATAALTSWMFRIVRNECLRRARTWRREIPAEAVDRPAPVGSAEEQALDRLDAERVAAAIRALPETQRRVLILRDVLGHPGGAVAESLGLSIAAMKSQLHRARTALRRNLRDSGTGAGRG